MPILATLLGNAFTAMVAFFAAYMTKKAAIGAALGALMVACSISVQGAVLALWTALSFATPEWLIAVLRFLAYLMPDNLIEMMQALCLAVFWRWLCKRTEEWAKVIASA